MFWNVEYKTELQAAQSEDENKESLRVTLDKLLPFMKVHEKADVNVDTLDALLEIIHEDSYLVEQVEKFTYMETRHVYDHIFEIFSISVEFHNKLSAVSVINWDRLD